MKMKPEIIYCLVCVLIVADCKQAGNKDNPGSLSATGKVLCLNYIRSKSLRLFFILWVDAIARNRPINKQNYVIAEKKVKTCSPPACNISIYASVVSGTYGLNEGVKKKFVQLGRPTVYNNYGNISVEQKHHVSVVLNEFLEISRPFWLNAVTDFTVEDFFFVNYDYWQGDSYGPFVNEIFLAEYIPNMLRGNSSFYTVKQSSNFSRENTVKLSPCTSYSANGTVEVLTYPFWSHLSVWVTGKDSDGNPVLASDLKEALPDGLSFEDTYWDYQVICQSYNRMRTVYVGSVAYNGYAAKLPNCII